MRARRNVSSVITGFGSTPVGRLIHREGYGLPATTLRKARSKSCTSGEASSRKPWPRCAELRRLSALDPNWQWNRCAIIARNWADLDPARSACMACDIPVQSAREELSSFWRARETQRFLRTLESGNSTAIETQAIRHHREDVGRGPWADLLAQALDELILDEGHAEMMPVAFVRNWLGEWSRDIRRRQQGLLLTSAHRAKGLEFDHVVVLDGRWVAASDAEDPDAGRRLYYVSMTRARKTLALVNLEDTGQPDSRDMPLQARPEERTATLVQPLRNTLSVLEREIPSPDISDPRLEVLVAECTMKDVVLSFAGWRPARSDCHRAIAAPFSRGSAFRVAGGRPLENPRPPWMPGRPHVEELDPAAWDGNRPRARPGYLHPPGRRRLRTKGAGGRCVPALGRSSCLNYSCRVIRLRARTGPEGTPPLDHSGTPELSAPSQLEHCSCPLSTLPLNS